MKTPIRGSRGSRCGLCYWALYDGETCTNPECIYHGKAPESVVWLTNEEALTLINAKPKPLTNQPTKNINLQALFDGMSQWQNERAASQMTLGKLIDTLAAMPPETEIQGFGEPHSYRGYYTDLAFENADGKNTAGNLLKIAKECMGEVFTGYKGGSYQMGRNTPVWISYHGQCGVKLMGIRPDGTLETEDDE